MTHATDEKIKDINDDVYLKYVYVHFLMYYIPGIVHRDLKLENILIAGCRTTEDGEPLYDIKVGSYKSVH